MSYGYNSVDSTQNFKSSKSDLSLIRSISDWNDLINDLVLTTLALIVLYRIRRSPLTRDNKFLVGISGLIALAGIAHVPYDALEIAGGG